MDRGTFLEFDGRPAVRFQRTYTHPVARLWKAITESTELGRWFPSTVSMQPQVGGTITFTGDPHTEPSTGTILEFEPPHRLAYTWGDDELHFELESVGEGQCQLTLIDVLEASEAAARNAAGWEVCLAELDKSVSNVPSNGPHEGTTQSWQKAFDAYVAAGMPAGAPIPGQ